MDKYERCAVDGCEARDYAGGLCTDITRPHATTLIQKEGPFFRMRKYCAEHLAEFETVAGEPLLYRYNQNTGTLEPN